MDWRTVLCAFVLVYYADGYSKYGRTCKDIGCLNSEVCVLAEDPCSIGHNSNCGTYPTCKKKSQVDGGSHSEPAKPPAPRPQPPSYDSVPNYNPPAPPSHTTSGGGSPYRGGSPYGGNSPYGGGNSPYGGGGAPYGGGGSSYGGGGSSYGGGGSSYGGGGSPIDSILSNINKYANGGGGSAGTGGSAGSGLSNIFGNILGNLSKNTGGLTNLFNTRPIMENPNYSSYGSNSRSSYPQSYPSGSQPTYQQPNQNKKYGQSNAQHNGATTRKPVHYGWAISVTVVLTYLIQQYVQSVIRN